MGVDVAEAAGEGVISTFGSPLPPSQAERTSMPAEARAMSHLIGAASPAARYIRSGALTPMSERARASASFAAAHSFSRALDSASSSETTRHFS